MTPTDGLSNLLTLPLLPQVSSPQVFSDTRLPVIGTMTIITITITTATAADTTAIDRPWS